MRFDRLSVLFVMIFLTGCTALQRRQDQTQPQPAQDGGPFSVDEPKAPPAPPPTPVMPKKIGIILGPGGAKALAHAGVLKELQKARIPIHSVIGLEWGALVGGLYAQRGQSHEMEWKLYKLEKQNLPGKGFLSSRLKPESIASLREYLRDSFSRQDAAKTQLEFSCPAQTVDVSDFRWLNRGELAGTVETCMAFPPLFVSERGLWAGAGAANAAVDRLRAEGADFIIFVNVLNSGPLADLRQLPDSGASAILWQEVRRDLRAASVRVNEWIEVDTAAVFLSDFTKRRELVAAGEKAGLNAAKTMANKYGF